MVLVIVGLVAALFYFADFSRSMSLNRSAIGFQGLAVWLDHNDIDATIFYGGDAIETDDFGLRVLPLYDVDLDAQAPATQSDTERTFQETLHDMPAGVLRSKMRSIPTLVVLPKWRFGMPETGVARRSFLVDEDNLNRLVSRQFPDAGSVRRPQGSPLILDQPNGDRIVLHQPQFVGAGVCDPILGDDTRMLLGRCVSDDGMEYWLLSDPDLLDNHGLTQGDNAAVAVDQLSKLAAGEPIVIDTTNRVWTFARRDADVPTPTRSWVDLARFFAFPFSIIWISLVLLAALVLWRAWRRYGPVDTVSSDEAAPKASRDASIEVKARMLRLTGHDAAIVRTHVGNRLVALSAEILGPHRGRGADGLNALLRAAARRSVSLSNDLRNCLEHSKITEKSSARDLLNYAEHVNDLITRTRNEFGRSESGR